MQILAGNARKVSAVRFERINNGEEMLESNEVTKMVPKIMKRRWSNEEDSDSADYDGEAFSKRPQDSRLSDEVDHESEDVHDRSG